MRNIHSSYTYRSESLIFAQTVKPITNSSLISPRIHAAAAPAAAPARHITTRQANSSRSPIIDHRSHLLALEQLWPRCVFHAFSAAVSFNTIEWFC
ncbi:hypothetical protein E2C01_008724 [Portunus trituberculatus]|uniref:Uncharacterized protein n=1 Tax=Portunus trituberculatus TaxID=210409 RepID=A0A5B7D2R0_PORTR|nr:hypothetical protein [Portunus trituberculatus]